MLLAGLLCPATGVESGRREDREEDNLKTSLLPIRHPPKARTFLQLVASVSKLMGPARKGTRNRAHISVGVFKLQSCPSATSRPLLWVLFRSNNSSRITAACRLKNTEISKTVPKNRNRLLLTGARQRCMEPPQEPLSARKTHTG